MRADYDSEANALSIDLIQFDLFERQDRHLAAAWRRRFVLSNRHKNFRPRQFPGASCPTRGC